MKLVKRILLALLAALILVYAVDYLSWRARMPASQSTLQVNPYYAVPQKDGKTEFILLDTVDQPCVKSLFPHAGNPPCWYLQRHTQKRIDM
jgi:hypothetical protein